MRKLEDGKYMYDEDTPWDRVFLWSFGFLCVCLLFFYSSFRVWTYWKAEGAAAFEPFDGTGILYLIIAANTLIWFPRVVKGLFYAVRGAKVGKAND